MTMNNIDLIKSRYTNTRDTICFDLGITPTDKISCPFPDHPDHNPSCIWNESVKQFYCFTCAKGYDIIDHYELYKNLTKHEAILQLCKELYINISDEFSPPAKAYKKPESIATIPDKYTSELNKLAIIPEWLCEDFLIDRNIEPHVAWNHYLTARTKTEILFHHVERSANGVDWNPIATKRRKLNKSNYSNGSKEIAVTGGKPAFFGLNTLLDDKGNFKKIVVICEGHIDALILASEIYLHGASNLYSVISVPNGAGTIKAGMENSPTFINWLKDHCQKIILIPDADNAGKLMIEHAKKYLPAEKLYIVDLCKLKGIEFTKKHGKDLGDALSKHDWDKILDMAFLNVPNIKRLSDVPIPKLRESIASGFATHDYNDQGLKMGNITLLSGVRGDGKTTIAIQMVSNVIKRDNKAFMYLAEAGDYQQAINDLVLLDCPENDILMRINYDKEIYYASDEMKQVYNDKYDKYLELWSDPRSGSHVFVELMPAMKAAAKRGSKIFIIDSMMVITNTTSKNIFQEQAKVIMALKQFCEDFNTHVVLIAHLNASGTKVSGAMEIENYVDTILRYVRVQPIFNNDDLKMLNKLFPRAHADDISRITALVFNLKVREKGSAFTMMLSWDETLGKLTDLVYQKRIKPLGAKYENNGFSSQNLNRIKDVDVPTETIKKEK